MANEAGKKNRLLLAIWTNGQGPKQMEAFGSLPECLDLIDSVSSAMISIHDLVSRPGGYGQTGSNHQQNECRQPELPTTTAAF